MQPLDRPILPIRAMQHRKPHLYIQGPLGKSLKADPRGRGREIGHLWSSALAKNLFSNRWGPPAPQAIDIETAHPIALGIVSAAQARPDRGGGTNRNSVFAGGPAEHQANKGRSGGIGHGGRQTSEAKRYQCREKAPEVCGEVLAMDDPDPPQQSR